MKPIAYGCLALTPNENDYLSFPREHVPVKTVARFLSFPLKPVPTKAGTGIQYLLNWITGQAWDDTEELKIIFELIPHDGCVTHNQGKFLSDIAIPVIPAEAGIQDLR